MMVDELWEYWSFERMANVGHMSDEGGGTWSHLFVLWAAGETARMLDELSVCFVGRTVHKIEPWGFCLGVNP